MEFGQLINPPGVRLYRPLSELSQGEVIDETLSQLTPWGGVMILAAFPFGRDPGRALAAAVTCDLFMYAFFGRGSDYKVRPRTAPPHGERPRATAAPTAPVAKLGVVLGGIGRRVPATRTTEWQP